MKIYQIEICNVCNLSCGYCPHVKQKRKKGYMTFEQYKKTIELVKMCGQKKVFLHNFGEPLMHPQLCDILSYTVSEGLQPDFFTNGILLDEERIRGLFVSGLRHISISEHQKGVADRVQELIEKTGVDMQITNIFRYEEPRHDWSGQLDNLSRKPIGDTAPCIFEKQNAFVVLWDGKINTCCIAVEDQLNLTVDNLLNGIPYAFTKTNLCRSCGLMRKDEYLD